jgi:antitoxin (DNA-binding transcriptional repressor) of toxin-antitoxin stability system
MMLFVRWKRSAMETLIAMQDIRTHLASIADRAESGETFVVIRNSRPVFRIQPIATSAESTSPGRSTIPIREVRERFAKYPVKADELTPGDLDTIICDARTNRSKPSPS